MLKSKRTLSFFNWESYVKGDTSSIPWQANADWALAQLAAFIGSKLPLARNSEGKYSFPATIKKWSDMFKNNEFILFEDGNVCTPNALFGILNFANHDPRGQMLPNKVKQTSDEMKRYNASVPFVLSCFKQYRNINYNDWDFSDLKCGEFFLDKSFLELATALGEYNNSLSATSLGTGNATAQQSGPRGPLAVIEGLSLEDKLELRETARIVKKDGSTKPYDLVTTINRLGVPEFDELPRLLKLMVLQVWVFQPHHLHKYSVSNPFDWDTTAEPLVSTVLTKPEPIKLNPHNPFDLL